MDQVTGLVDQTQQPHDRVEQLVVGVAGRDAAPSCGRARGARVGRALLAELDLLMAIDGFPTIADLRAAGAQRV
jgi:hypothetical protein